MKKILKYALGLVVVLLLGISIAIIVFIKFVDPNRYKPFIVAQIKTYTHQDVAIDGNLSWAFFPDIGIQAEKIKIKGIDVAVMTVNIKLMPILHGKLDIAGITIRDASMHAGAYDVSNIDIQASDIQFNRPFPVSVQANLSSRTIKKPIKMNFAAHINLDRNKEILSSDDVALSVASVNLTGRIRATKIFSLPTISARFLLSPFDLNDLLTSLGQKSALINADDMEGSLNVDVKNNTLEANGKLLTNALAIRGLKLTHVTIPYQFKSSVLSLTPMSADLYQGKLQANAAIDLKKFQPHIDINAVLSNIQIESLWHDLSSKQSKFNMQGRANANFQLATDGFDPVMMQRNLHGAGSMTAVNGVLIGVDVGHLIDSATAAMQNQSLPSSTSTDKTNFDRISASFTVKNGVIYNNDFLLVSSQFSTKGDGRIDLPSNWINYVFQTTVKQQSWSQVAIPVAVRGSLSNPSISIDAGLLLREVAKSQQERAKANLKENLKSQIQKNIQGPAGDLLQGLIQ